VTDSAIRSLKQEIRKNLEANSDSAYLQDIKGFVPGPSAVIGVRVPILRDIVKKFKSDHKELTLELASQMLTVFCNGRCREEILSEYSLSRVSVRRLLLKRFQRYGRILISGLIVSIIGKLAISWP
jgi:DNA alkylation repair enzyme